MSKFCHDCILLFCLKPPSSSYSLFVMGECEGCKNQCYVTNPEFYISEKNPTQSYASTAFLNKEMMDLTEANMP